MSASLLLDTHVFLWWVTGSDRLSRTVKSRIASAGHVYVSAASAWEASIKSGLGRLDLLDSFATMAEASEFEELPVRFAHADRVRRLPPLHSDPFDRMLIAQALEDGLTLVTHDRAFERYEVEVVWA